ncbi:unnamed protein product [Blepharisma stoltei]|uniref:Tyrosine-protein kinase ephrin type A/B receptor-like domain-containing protein n=1 Tax=Blepharisma stoltei TaxID=1481888 RepID=A0AAU9IQU1_9CILI|nr:unnamed protein product [Blepharisma stoltei]
MSKNGPLNELWAFDLENLQWNQINQYGDVPPCRYRFAYKKFIDQSGSLKFAVFGGSLGNGLDNNLFILNVANFTWQKQKNNGADIKKYRGATMEYYNGCLYVAGGDVNNVLYSETSYPNLFWKYDLSLQKWYNLTNTISWYQNRYLSGSAIYNDFYYLFYGWSDQIDGDVNTVDRVDLSDPSYKWTKASINELKNYYLIPRDSFGFTSNDNKFYIFGGYNDYISIGNSLIELDLSISPITYQTLSIERLDPIPRMHHSLVLISTNLYLFGGVNKNTYLNDLWLYDSISDSWSIVTAKGAAPSARASHAAASQGKVFLIWGGETIDGYVNDMYKFEPSSKVWTEIIPDSSSFPSKRKGACMVVDIPYVYIFGGLTDTGASNELWSFDIGKNEWELIDYNGKVPSAAYPTCEVITQNNTKFIYAMYGYTDGSAPLGSIYAFSVESKTWIKIYDPAPDIPYSNRAGAAIKYLNNKVLVIGGEEWSTDPRKDVYFFDLSKQKTLQIGALPEFYYNGASVYFKNHVYMHAGGSVIGSTMRNAIAKNSFFFLDISCSYGKICGSVCSIGTYASNNDCLLCPEGTYNDAIGQSSCIKCPEGTYNPTKAASDVRQCLPCANGWFSDIEGAVYCKECPSGSYCLTGSSYPSSSKLELISESQQPDLYKADIDKLNLGVEIGLSILIISVCFSLIFLIFLRKHRNHMTAWDLYDDMHNRKIGQNIILHKNGFGGIFSLIFIFISLFIIYDSILEYSLNNIIETKALVPIVSVQYEISEFTANIEITAKFHQYGGSCSEIANKCSSSISIITSDLTYYSIKFKCSKSEDNSCIITTNCYNCVINTGAYIYYNLHEIQSFASAISLNVTSESSIPNEMSSVYQNLLPSNGTIFRGYHESNFSLNMIPSVFQSYTLEWPRKITGYHISIDNPPLPGSQCSIVDLPFTAGLKLKVILDKSESSLYTTRDISKTFMILVSSLLGSVFGVMEVVGGVMKFFEEIESEMLEKIKNRNNWKDVKDNRKHLGIELNKQECVEEENEEGGEMEKLKGLGPVNTRHNSLVETPRFIEKLYELNKDF